MVDMSKGGFTVGSGASDHNKHRTPLTQYQFSRIITRIKINKRPCKKNGEGGEVFVVNRLD